MPGNRGRKRKNPRDGGQREKRPLGHHPRQTRAQARAMQTLLNPPSVANSDAAGYGPEEQRPLSSGAEVIPPEVTCTHAAATSVTATAVNAAGRPVHPQIPASQQPTPLAGNSSGASSSFQRPAAQETAAHGGNFQLGAATYTTAATPAPVAGTPPAFARPSPIYTSPPAGVVTSSPVAIPTPSAAPSGAMHPLYQQAYVSGMAPSYFTGFQGVPVAHPSTTPIPGSSTSSGQLGQPAKGYQNPSTSGTTRTWVVGDSIVFRAGDHAPNEPALGLITWRGVRGAKISSMIPSIRAQLQHSPVPTTIVIHLGTNDLFSIPVKEIRGRLEEGLQGLRHMLPHTRIVWSDILLRLFYYGEERPGVGKKNVNALNKYAHRVCKNLGNAHGIVHSCTINSSQQSLYWRDGLHLSTLGSQQFCKNISAALAFFTSHPSALLHPPSS
ncbi:LIM domain-binding protein 3-like isoform X2 [Patiria miniata]|uniref:SGNH hydrolase-type esterase domain-containing protein n=1 Tax=Patiria miniata TaxID=46514 RepID=A0A914AH36_PATMI|nr:LIM domain-binding protein 3-like isoform X2 [Patiria miniata]